jgi:SAM-dependent methyltransferase
MAKHESIDWYETPLYYDIVFEEDTTREGDFIETALERFGRLRRRPRGKPRLLEPACGSGRLVAEMARRGYAVTGFDRLPQALEFARRRLEQQRLRARLVEGSLESFRFPGKFAVAHCLVSTFKYLLTGKAARDHLRCMARALERGGIYLLGFHLSDYRWPFCQHERWVNERDGVRVVCNIRSWPPDPVTRRERCRSRLRIEEDGRVKLAETNWWFRTYDADQARRLLATVPELEHVATYDFCYDWTRPRELDMKLLDTLLILRRR